jgi:SAM-dependent methyltransferase
MTTYAQAHWQKVYQTRSPAQVSWYEPVPELSLELIRATGIALATPVLDVGSGASTLVDQLLGAGYTDVTALDIAPAALAETRARLGPAAERVHWIVADVTSWTPDRRYGLWHDRAALHFLVDPLLRGRYLEVLRAALLPGGHAVVATFGPEGPVTCSGLSVQRYSAGELSAALGAGFRLMRAQLHAHVTPAGRTQQFLYGWWQAQM